MNNEGNIIMGKDQPITLEVIAYRLNEIDKKIDTMQESIDQVTKWTIEKQADCKTHQTTSAEMNVQLNGTPDCPAVGISKRLDVIENKMDWLDELKTRITVLQWTGWVLLFAATGWFFVTCILPAIEKLAKHAA